MFRRFLLLAWGVAALVNAQPTPPAQTYVADLAVRLSRQRQGIGKELLRHTQAAAPDAYMTLLAAPKAAGYYPRIGFRAHPSAWILDRGAAVS